MSGGSGYVLTRETIRRFVEVLVPAPNESTNANSSAEITTPYSICEPGHKGPEDLNLGNSDYKQLL